MWLLVWFPVPEYVKSALNPWHFQFKDIRRQFIFTEPLLADLIFFRSAVRQKGLATVATRQGQNAFESCHFHLLSWPLYCFDWASNASPSTLPETIRSPCLATQQRKNSLAYATFNHWLDQVITVSGWLIVQIFSNGLSWIVVEVINNLQLYSRVDYSVKLVNLTFIVQNVLWYNWYVILFFILDPLAPLETCPPSSPSWSGDIVKHFSVFWPWK